MSYFAEKEKRIFDFEDTLMFCERERNLLKAIQYSREHTRIWNISDLNSLIMKKNDFVKSYFVNTSKQDIFEKIKKMKRNHPQRRIGVVNIELSGYPGGSVIQGGMGFEEDMCRYSTLYPCLNTTRLHSDYYKKRECLHGRQCEKVSCIYIPDIICMKSDMSSSILLEEEEWYKVDVIVCNVMDVSDWEKNMENKQAEESFGIRNDKNGNLTIEEEIRFGKLYELRSQMICKLARDCGIDSLIWGLPDGLKEYQ